MANLKRFTKSQNLNLKVFLKVSPNVLRLCVCLPLAQGFNLPTNLMGQIAQNRCYTLGGIIAQMLN